MDVSNASYYINIHKNNKNKGIKMGQTKKKKNLSKTSKTFFSLFLLVRNYRKQLF
jgi:hypothetical protein